METIRLATMGLADEVDPKCIIVCAQELRTGSTGEHRPVDCGKSASADNHSIQENGVLSLISRAEQDGSRKVFRFFPTASRLANLTKGTAGYPGSEWIWKVERLEPDLVPISLASIGHFACGDHDGYTFEPVDKMVLSDGDSYFRIDERHCSKESRDLARRLALLAYRTLLYRISQFRGTESVIADQLAKFVRTGNRFAVDSLRENLDETAQVMTPLYRHKSLFDRRLTDVARCPLVHHIAPFTPIVPYAASEYLPIRHLTGKGKQQEELAFVSCNVLPSKDRTWFIVSHPATSDPSLETSASNYVRNFTCETPMLRKKQDLKFLSDCTNVYASPDGYRLLHSEDQDAIETAMAWNICEKPYEKTLQRLKSSPAGSKLIEKIQKEITLEAV